MDENPRRRKHKDNPYTIIKDENSYFVIFKDVLGNIQKISITEELYSVFNEFELRDLSQMNEYDRHTERTEIYENTLEKRAKDKKTSIEDEFIQKAVFEELKIAIEKLNEPYKKRIKMYYFEDKNEKEIAKIEGISQQAVSKSLYIAIKKLKDFLKNFQN